MGKHLTMSEKLNAQNELEENKAKIKELREKTQQLQNRNKKLQNFLFNAKSSKYKGMYGIDGVCYKMFGKKASELTLEERRAYNAFKASEYRKNAKVEGQQCKTKSKC